MPNNYSFIDDYVSGSAYPNDLDDMQQYEQDGITTIISLTPRLPLVSKYYEGDKIEFHHFPVYATPDRQQIEDFIVLIKERIENKEKIMIHCQYGQERTGIFLATYLIEVQGKSVDEAISFIQNNRTGSLQTHHALQFIKKYYK